MMEGLISRRTYPSRLDINWSIVLYYNGDVYFSSAFTNIDVAMPHTYGLVCGFRDSIRGKPTNIFTFSGHGYLQAGEVGRPVNYFGNNQYVKLFWNRIHAGPKELHCGARPDSSQSELYKSVMEDIRKDDTIIDIYSIYG